MADGPDAAAFRKEGRNIILSRESGEPLWKQLSTQLEGLIYAGRIAPHSRIPSEPALCEIFQVSRPVVRNALASLASKGLVVKLPRKGMFVGHQPADTDFLVTNRNLFEDLEARGRSVTTKTFELLRAAADEEERSALRLAEGDDVVRIGRVFWADGQPMTYANIVFPAAKVPGLETMDLEDRSILGIVRDVYGRSIHHAKRWFNACMPNAEVIDRMDMTPNQPMIWIESIAFEADGSPLEFYKAYYNSQTARICIPTTFGADNS